MTRIAIVAGLASAIVAPPMAAQAHAVLDHAVPGVGTTVAAAPNELVLTFTQEVVPALSSVRVALAGSTAVDTAKPVVQGKTLRVRLSRPLGGGRYVVTWHVVSVDTHPTSGHYAFTVAP